MNFDAIADEVGKDFDAECAANPQKAAKVTAAPGVSGPVGGFIAEILKGLRSGGMGVFASLSWLPIVIELIVKYGPQVLKIIKEIIDGWKGGQTPISFAKTL